MVKKNMKTIRFCPLCEALSGFFDFALMAAIQGQSVCPLSTDLFKNLLNVKDKDSF